MSLNFSVLEKQSREFDAVEKLSKCYKNIQLTPIVDDDYPEIRHHYESAIYELIQAMKNNGRFKESS